MPGFGLLRNSTPRHPSQSLRSLFCKQKKIYERQARLAISKRLISGLLADNSQSEKRHGPASGAAAPLRRGSLPLAVFVLRTSPRQAGSLVCAYGLPRAFRIMFEVLLCRIARLHLLPQIAPRQSSPPGSLVCATGLPRRNLGFAEMKTGGGCARSDETF